jgi:hypothetical protein
MLAIATQSHRIYLAGSSFSRHHFQNGLFVSPNLKIVVYYFIQINRYMFRSYDHLQAEIYPIYIFPPENSRTTETCGG